MTKVESLTLTTMTANAWLALHTEELNNARSATSWAHYQELNSNKSTAMARAEWYGLKQFCDAVGIDMNNDSVLATSVVEIMRECSELMTKTFKIYREFPDYPFRNPNAVIENSDLLED